MEYTSNMIFIKHKKTFSDTFLNVFQSQHNVGYGKISNKFNLPEMKVLYNTILFQESQPFSEKNIS